MPIPRPHSGVFHISGVIMSVPGSTYARGYDYRHEQLRAWWKPKVEAGGIPCFAIVCLMPNRLILPGQLWDLDHTPDRTGYLGPSHRRCNRAAGARKGNRSPLRRRATIRRSRVW